ncbi:MAG: hypothetical protein R2748_04500 [Bryobacterales bacterium]
MAWWIWMLAGLALAGLELASGGDFFLLLLGVSAMLVSLCVAIGVANPFWAGCALLRVLLGDGVLAAQQAEGALSCAEER